jgi:hypothetical protein
MSDPAQNVEGKKGRFIGYQKESKERRNLCLFMFGTYPLMYQRMFSARPSRLLVR